jgi:predicted DNA-binding transcriptional regulator YafY
MSTALQTSLQRLHDLFRDGHAFTYSEIIDRLDITTTRQARRLIRQLQGEDVPVQDRRRGREKEFYLPEEELRIELGPDAPTEREALALIVAAEAGRTLLGPTPLGPPLERGLKRLRDRLAASANTYDLDRIHQHWYFGTRPSATHFDPDVFDQLIRALNERRKVEIIYDPVKTSNAPRERKITPLVMAAPGGSWRCISYCHHREDWRDFALSRIGEIELQEPHVGADPFDEFDSSVHFRERFGSLSGEVQVVRLLVEPHCTVYFREKEYHATQVIEENKRDDDRIVVSFEVAGLNEFGSWVRSWGSAVTVLDPPELAGEVAKEARAVAERYARMSSENGHPESGSLDKDE